LPAPAPGDATRDTACADEASPGRRVSEHPASTTTNRETASGDFMAAGHLASTKQHLNNSLRKGDGRCNGRGCRQVRAGMAATI